MQRGSSAGRLPDRSDGRDAPAIVVSKANVVYGCCAAAATSESPPSLLGVAHRRFGAASDVCGRSRRRSADRARDGWAALLVRWRSRPPATMLQYASCSAVEWLHRAVYVAAALTFAHWILSAFDPIPGTIHVGVAPTFEAIRLWKTHA